MLVCILEDLREEEEEEKKKKNKKKKKQRCDKILHCAFLVLAAIGCACNITPPEPVSRMA